jgi:hypothetical protein
VHFGQERPLELSARRHPLNGRSKPDSRSIELATSSGEKGRPGTGKSTFAEYAGRLCYVPSSARIGSKPRYGAPASDVRRTRGGPPTTCSRHSQKTSFAQAVRHSGQRRQVRAHQIQLALPSGPVRCRLSRCRVCLLGPRTTAQAAGGEESRHPRLAGALLGGSRKRRPRYELWQDDRLVLDTTHPLEGNLDALHTYLL